MIASLLSTVTAILAGLVLGEIVSSLFIKERKDGPGNNDE
jgi:hypothetical protein